MPLATAQTPRPKDIPAIPDGQRRFGSGWMRCARKAWRFAVADVSRLDLASKVDAVQGTCVEVEPMRMLSGGY